MLAITGFAVQELAWSTNPDPYPNANANPNPNPADPDPNLRRVQEFVWSKPVIEQTPFFFGR